MTPFQKLVAVMATLRSPGGCPWDREQDHHTLKPYFVEEVYEALDAIEAGDPPHLCEELGDVLLQIVFHARIAEENGDFTIDDVVNSIVEKLVRRHPHVFAETDVADAGEVIRNWEQIKREERAGQERENPSVLDGLPRNLPALMRARRMQEKVSRFGFDWERAEDVMRKVDEELGELKEAGMEGNQAKIEEELGDLLFAVANLARFVSVCPEDALRKTIDKFQRRFGYIERELPKRGGKLGEASLEELDALWDEAKERERNGEAD